jgi:quercetin dioxygenase-like cupin family protein
MDSFLLAYLIRLGEFYCNVTDKGKRLVEIHNNINHHDGYAVCINFTYKGDDNPLHAHAGDLSGVIYYQNDGLETYFVHAPPYVGKKGDIIMFPANFSHGVLEKQTEEERITLSYNLNVLNHRG